MRFPRNPQSLETLCSFGIAILQSSLQRDGSSLGRIDRELSPGGTWGTLSYSFKGMRGGNPGKIEIRKDDTGLLLEFDGGKYRYYLERRESNLKPGTYRYYIIDPYSLEEALCEKLYYLPGVDMFLPYSVLRSHRVLYQQQRKGHRDRYYTPKDLPKTRYRKTHYRGRITPFWARYQALQEREETKFIEFSVGNGMGPSGLPPEARLGIVEDYCKHSGRKTLPRRGVLPTFGLLSRLGRFRI